jgi:3-deoxy-D-manno-octulosonic-acid transferase
MEPAAWGVPILSGPHLFNFSEASKLLIAADALHLASNASELALEVDSLLRDSSLRAQRGAAALHVVEENRGAMERLLAAITLQLSR